MYEVGTCILCLVFVLCISSFIPFFMFKFMTADGTGPPFIVRQYEMYIHFVH